MTFTLESPEPADEPADEGERILTELAEGRRERIEGPDYQLKAKVSPEVLAQFEQYVKTGVEFELTPDNVLDVFALAKEFGYFLLLMVCAATMEQYGITPPPDDA
jgi:hypothetical protein